MDVQIYRKIYEAQFFRFLSKKFAKKKLFLDRLKQDTPLNILKWFCMGVQEPA